MSRSDQDQRRSESIVEPTYHTQYLLPSKVSPWKYFVSWILAEMLSVFWLATRAQCHPLGHSNCTVMNCTAGLLVTVFTRLADVWDNVGMFYLGCVSAPWCAIITHTAPIISHVSQTRPTKKKSGKFNSINKVWEPTCQQNFLRQLQVAPGSLHKSETESQEKFFPGHSFS